MDKEGLKEVNLHDEFDSRVWAEEFNKTLVKLGQQPFDPGFLIGWFANAIMAGYDHVKNSTPPLQELEEDNKFIRHIQEHLKPGQEVICKICGKTAKEITGESHFSAPKIDVEKLKPCPNKSCDKGRAMDEDGLVGKCEVCRGTGSVAG